ncbi:MAG: hypothetical protein ABIQ58_09295 [Candidatus Limnocylindrales bacterium]
MPVSEPVSPNDRVTAAFARVSDARYAIGILESCGLASVHISVETMNDERGEVSLVIMRVELDGISRDRVLTAISGGHGFPVADPRPADPTLASAPIERVA